MESGSDQFRIAFAKQNGPIRIALYSDPSEFHHIGVTEHFAPDFEDQGRFVERGTLFCQRQGEAIAAQFQNIHFRMIFLVWVYAAKRVRCPFEGFSFGFASEAKIYIVFPIRKIIVELHR